MTVWALILSNSLIYSQTEGAEGSASDAQNLLEDLSAEQLNDLQWLNEPTDYSITDGTLTITASKSTDFFINPEDMAATASAPFLYKDVTGDFVAIAQVRPDLTALWNAAGLLLMIDEINWIKLVFEVSDATGPGIVTVTTKGISDDANGVRLSASSEIWLKLVRKGNNYSMLWSEDGTDYKMARLSAMPPSASVKIGLEAQCPAGESAVHKFQHFSIESRTVKDLRKGD